MDFLSSLMLTSNRNPVYLRGRIRIKPFISLPPPLTPLALPIADISFMYCRVYISYEYGRLLSATRAHFVSDVNDDKGSRNLRYDITPINNKNCSFHLTYEHSVTLHTILKIM